jgi:hypothetical protein
MIGPLGVTEGKCFSSYPKWAMAKEFEPSKFTGETPV